MTKEKNDILQNKFGVTDKQFGSLVKKINCMTTIQKAWKMIYLLTQSPRPLQLIFIEGGGNVSPNNVLETE